MDLSVYLTATMCCLMIAVASEDGTLSSSHFFIVRAFNIVSAVVNVLLTMTTAIAIHRTISIRK